MLINFAIPKITNSATDVNKVFQTKLCINPMSYQCSREVALVENSSGAIDISIELLPFITKI